MNPSSLQATHLSRGTQMQWMRPAQLEAAARKFPVVYVPFGVVEWHGYHLPLGVDALKAHAILVRCAEKHGGVVYPPIYFPYADSQLGESVAMITRLFERLKKTGFRVIMGVSGHNVQEQIDMIDRALAPVTADGTVAGGGFWEFDLAENPEAYSDHAAKWETSDMLHFYPESVDLTALGTEPIAFDMKPPHGMHGDDPRTHASAAVGARKCELCVDALGEKARALLASLAPGCREFGLQGVRPEHWWMV